MQSSGAERLLDALVAASLAAVVPLWNISTQREVGWGETRSKQDELEAKKKEEAEQKQLPARTESGNRSRLLLICWQSCLQLYQLRHYVVLGCWTW